VPHHVTGELIQQYGRQLRDLDVQLVRAAELAVEVERHNRAILNAATDKLDFNDEPSRFLSALHDLRDPNRPTLRVPHTKAR